MVDPRQPRFGQAITGIAVLTAFILKVPVVLPIVAAVLGFASILGPRFNLYAYGFRIFKRLARLGPPRELEEAAPPRFANTLGFVFLTVAALLHYWAGLNAVAWGLGLLVSALALLAGATGLCVGCEAYVIGRRLLAKPERARA